MRYGPLGQSGLLVSVVGLGCNNFGSRLDMDATRAVVDAAIDAGITLFDTSDTYGGGGGSERALGEILGSRRGQVVLATKFGGQGVDMGYGPAAGAKGGRAYIRRAIAGSRLASRRGYVTEEKLAQVEALITWAQAHGVTILEAAIGALAAQPGCSSVIAGATTAEQVKANAAASEWIPSADELAEIDGIVPPPAPAA
jgi:aryl-alcohol dehydrogenase-like predicted oxidoreductase